MMGLFYKYILNKYDTISFDVFDTLIERNCKEPSDIFRMTGEIILGKDNANDFRRKRILAENKAREIKKGHEVKLEEIYKAMDCSLEDKKSYLMNEEKNQEILNCRKKKKIFSLYDQSVKNGKNVILISDMYLSASMIKKMLYKCGISGYTQLYVSNDYDANKCSGKLFDIVVNDLSLNKKRMIHIGDSIKADFLGARRVGIKSILIDRKNRIRRILNYK